MGAQYLRRDGTVAAANALTTIATLNGSTVNDIQVPSGVSTIKAIIASISNSIQSVADAGATVNLRLIGNGIVDGGVMDMTIGSIKNGTTSTNGSINQPIYVPTDISVKSGNTVTIQVSQDGVDIGTLAASVCLVFQ